MRRLALPVALLVALAGAGAAAASGAVPARPGAEPLTGLPAGAPPAATRPEAALPAPAGWPFPEAFPRTSGTGRLAGGASYWTDFLYDDHGAAGIQVAQPISSLAPTDGTYVYPSGPADNNGADIFRAAVGYRDGASYWRVDWVTLADRNVPIAEWTIDSDRNTTTGVSGWAAGAGLSSPGIDHALVVSAKGAQLVDLLTGRTVRLATSVSMSARSFVVRVPTSVLPVSGSWRLRLAAGLADAAGTGFAPVSAAEGAAPGQPNVYNVTFRSVAQEPPQFQHGVLPNYVAAGRVDRLRDLGNYWSEDDQAQTLAGGDVSKFSHDVDWSALQRRAQTPEPLVYGYSNRWYATRLNLGQGVVANSGNSSEDLRPNYLSRVQPYAVYVPSSYRPDEPAPLTWILHSLSVNYNQYGALDPQLIQQACEDRHSICATTEGFGPDGWYYDEAEVDFWSVWHELAQAYRLDPQRTVLTGYSMGGFAAYKLGLTYPDLFAGAIALAGPPICGLRVYGPLAGAAGPGRCTTDGDTTPLVTNARWLPYALDDGVADELVPISGVLEQEKAFLDAGERLHAQIYPAEDHLFYATQDAFEAAVSAIGTPTRVLDPPSIDYTFYPNLVEPRLGIGPTRVYWITSLVGRDSAPGVLAHVVATDAAIPAPRVTPVQTEALQPTADPSPALLVQQTWRLGSAAPLVRVLSLRLTDVARVAVDPVRARLPHGSLTVTTDGPTTVIISGITGWQIEKAGTYRLGW